MRRISVRGIIFHQGKLLCVRLNPYSGSLRHGETSYWYLPGGGLDDGESLLDGVVREMIEETGITPRVGRLLYVQQFMYGEKDYLEFFFHITNSEDYLNIDLTQTTHGQEEIAEIGFVAQDETHIMPEFLKTENLQKFIESTEPTKLFSTL